MAINRKLMMILAVLMLGAVFLTGCGEGEETGLDGGPGITDPSGVGGEEGPGITDPSGVGGEEGPGPGGSAGGEEAGVGGEDEGQEEEAATLSGILKAIDDAAGTVTIESKTDGELVLEVNDEIKVFKGKVQATFEDLADNIGSEVIVEYNDRTKMATVIGILE